MKAQNGTPLARKDIALTLTQQTLDDIQDSRSGKLKFIGGEYFE